MYNRYAPSPNGQYQRRAMPERRTLENGHSQTVQGNPPPRPVSPAPQHQAASPPPPPQHFPPPPPQHFPPPPKPAPWQPENQPKPPECKSKLRIPFFDKLLPNFDTGDLLLLLILLLLMTDGEEDSSSVMLTIALFLFLQ